MGMGTSFPSTWTPNRAFLKTDEGKIYYNNGTEETPDFQELKIPPIEPNSFVLPYDETIGNFTTPSTYTSVSSEYSNPNSASNQFANTTNQNVVGSQGGYSPIGSYQATNRTASFYPAGGNPVNITNLTVTHSKETVPGYAGWTLGYWGYTVGTNDGNGFVGMGSMGGTTNLGTKNNFIGIHVYVRAYALGRYTLQATGTYVDSTPTHPIGNLTNNNANSKWISGSQVGNYVIVDMGSSTRTDHVAIKPDTVTTTETLLDIDTSDDASTWTTKRCILTSKLTDNQYNFIRFNPHNFRYIRIKGAGANAATMSIYDVKCKSNISDNTVQMTHGHMNISATDTGLGLSGV